MENFNLERIKIVTYKIIKEAGDVDETYNNYCIFTN